YFYPECTVCLLILLEYGAGNVHILFRDSKQGYALYGSGCSRRQKEGINPHGVHILLLVHMMYESVTGRRSQLEKVDIFKDIAERTGGDIYLGVVGAVRTGKST